MGVVLEVQMQTGLDTLAAYADHTARYINHGGKLIVWETSGNDMNRRIDALLTAGQRVADAIGPWKELRRGPPPNGHVRLNMLTPSGLHFGEGPFEILSTDPMEAPSEQARRVATQVFEDVLSVAECPLHVHHPIVLAESSQELFELRARSGQLACRVRVAQEAQHLPA